MKRVTIQDVAKELNLSRNTVAKALNNSNTVAYETRYVVIKKAYEMGYSKLLPVVLNEFKIKDSLEGIKTIVVLARRELSTFWNRIIMGISDELNKNNCKLQFNFISIEEERNHILPIEMNSEVDGVIVLSVFEEEYIKRIAAYGCPIVFLDSPQQSGELLPYGDIVLFEGQESVKSMTRQLIMQGAKSLGFIGDITYCRSIYERFQGFQTAVKLAGIKEDESLYKVGYKPNHYYDSKEVQEAIDALPYMPEGIVCANDDIAKDVILYLKEQGIRVPHDVMVTGFDNKDEMAFFTPSVTTAYISNQRMGKRLVQQLMWRILNREMPHEVITVGTEVVYKESSNRPK